MHIYVCTCMYMHFIMHARVLSLAGHRSLTDANELFQEFSTALYVHVKNMYTITVMVPENLQLQTVLSGLISAVCWSCDSYVILMWRQNMQLQTVLSGLISAVCWSCDSHVIFMRCQRSCSCRQYCLVSSVQYVGHVTVM